MTPWKDVLCLLAIFAVYGLAGHLDYKDAVAMEDALRADVPPPCFTPQDVAAEPALRVDDAPVRLGAANARQRLTVKHLDARDEILDGQQPMACSPLSTASALRRDIRD